MGSRSLSRDSTKSSINGLSPPNGFEIMLVGNVSGCLLHFQPPTDYPSVEQARNLTKKENLPLSINHYLENLPMLANQWSQYNYRDTHRQRLYLKDIDCPPLWHDKLKEQVPPGLFYLSDSIGDIGGPGAVEEPVPQGVGKRLGRGIARAGDLMSCMPPTMRAENLMCYIGHEGTYTPAHREMCASLGQNVMVEASGLVGVDGKPTKPGSSIWFMTETKDRFLVSEYWLSTLGHDIEVEAHFAQINAWKRAPFAVYIVEQKVGDFIIIPPLAPHQVWNRGTRTMKVAWNRTTVETLELALNEALPRARMVCRDEQYKNKAIVLFTLNRYSHLLKRMDELKHNAKDIEKLHHLTNNPKARQLEKDFKRLFPLFTKILLSETFTPSNPERKVEYLPYDSNVTCSYCRCNIFNRFLTCKYCLIPLENGEEDTYDICMECYAMGRSCKCRSKLTWVEQFPWKDLVQKYEMWRHQIIVLDGGSSRMSILPLYEAREQLNVKTLAQICQEQLKIRPWRDPTKEDSPENLDSEEDDGLNVDGTVKRKKKRPEKWYKDNFPCHICSHREPKWKQASCGCGTSFCYGSLWRGFDMMPQTIMEDKDWKCPKCRKFCTCSACAKDPKTRPYEPKGTILGHDTKKIADPRSIECLVDFSSSNMHWVKKAGDDHPNHNRRLLRAQDEAAKAKSRGPSLNEHYVDGEDELPTRQAINRDTDQSGIPIDPQLGAGTPSTMEPTDDRHTQQAAMAALNVMSGLSRLEQNPTAFMLQAGLGEASEAVSNGISYEYPEPEGFSQAMPASTSNGNYLSGTKRKRERDRPKVRSDADAPQDANHKFQQTQTQRTMTEARRKGRYISAQAALTGDSLIVKCRIDPSKLSRFDFPSSHEPFSVSADDPQASNVVESDLPKDVPDAVANARNPIVPKKRARGEIDADFKIRKRGERQSIPKPSAGHKLVSAEQEVDTSDVDSEEDMIHVPQVDKPGGENQPKRRSLPAYLARRSPVDDENLPKELSNTVSRRVPKPSKDALAHQSSSASPTEPSPISRKSFTVSSIGAAVAPSPVAEQPQSIRSSTTKSSEATATTESSATSRINAMANENLRAKMRAVGEVVDEPNPDSHSESSDSPIATVAPKGKKPKLSTPQLSTPEKKRGRGRPPGSSNKKRAAAAALEEATPSRKSIFSRRGRGNIRITSARSNVGR